MVDPFSAAMTALTVVQGTAKAVSCMTTLHKVAGDLKGLRDAQLQEFVEMWLVLGEMECPMQTALRYHGRQATSKRVDSVVRHCNSVIAECEDFLSKEDGEPDERPESEESWREWLGRAKGGKKRLESVGQLKSKLRLAVQQLTFALQDVLYLPEPLRAARADFARCESAYAAASSIVLKLMRGGATLHCVSAGHAYRLGHSAATGGQQLVAQGRVGVVLDWDKHCLGVRSAPQTQLEDEEEERCEEPFSIPLDGTAIRRLWGGTSFAEVRAKSGLPCGADAWACVPEDALCYLFQDTHGQAVLLQFEPVPRSGNDADECPVTAEIFELLCGWSQCAVETGQQQFNSSAELYSRKIFNDAGQLPYPRR